MKGILGKKIGMARIFDENGKTISVTIVEAQPCIITQVKTSNEDGYNAIQIGYGLDKKPNKPLAGHLKKSNAKSQIVKEIRLNNKEYKVGDTINLSIFKPEDIVAVTGISKGKGFMGTVRRHHFNTGPRTHGSDNYRQPGSIGATYPQRTIKGKRMAGQMGNKQITSRGLKIIEISEKENTILIKGPIPGCNNSMVFIKSKND